MMVAHSKELSEGRKGLTQDYREGKASAFGDAAKRLAYLGARMPATFAAVSLALKGVKGVRSLVDLGAGPGTASWAAVEMLEGLEKITLVELSAEAVAIGKKLMEGHARLKEAEWICRSLEGEIPGADLAVMSYVLNEVKDPRSIVKRCWEKVDTLVIVEPGTPKGFGLVRDLREELIRMGAYILAPCPHRMKCPSDWCHFAARVERSRLHRLLKGGTLGFEDEKFSYVVASKKKGVGFENRIVEAPMRQSGFVKLTLCTEKGQLEERIVSRKDKGLFRIAKKKDWGDSFTDSETESE